MVTEEIRKLQVETYKNNKNYKIEYSTTNTHSCCVVYFSSNAIFFPDTVETFVKSIKDKDRYEFSHMKIVNADKHIFIRDIYKLWYAHGINPTCNTFEKIAEFIKQESNCYKRLIFLGISAGGYAATVIASMLKVDLVLNFCGQWTLEYSKNKELRQLYENGNENLVQHWSLDSFEYDSPNLFYFCSIKNKRDAMHLQHVSFMKNIHIIKFRTSHHGVPFLKCTLPNIINMDYNALMELSQKTHIPILFDITQVGLFATMRCLYKEIRKKIKNKL